MKSRYRLQVVLAMVALGTTLLATAVESDETPPWYAPRWCWDCGGVIEYGDPDGGGGGRIYDGYGGTTVNENRGSSSIPMQEAVGLQIRWIMPIQLQTILLGGARPWSMRKW